MTYDHVLVERDDRFTTVTMNVPERRNALSLRHMEDLIDAFRAVGETDTRGVILAGNGPVFSAGHDFADMVGSGLGEMRRLLQTCTDLMNTMQSLPQPVVARVHGLATAAGCQLVATADLAVAADTAKFAAPGGRGGWFCHTPMVAIGRALPRKMALELALTGDPIDAPAALQGGLVNAVVPADELDAAVVSLLERATRGSLFSKALGKQAFYNQIDLDLPKAYAYAIEVMAAASQTADGQEWMAAFMEKRHPKWLNR
jgi:enoyl-CoA hydratase/carnithine racemase